MFVLHHQTRGVPGRSVINEPDEKFTSREAALYRASELIEKGVENVSIDGPDGTLTHGEIYRWKQGQQSR